MEMQRGRSLPAPPFSELEALATVMAMGWVPLRGSPFSSACWRSSPGDWLPSERYGECRTRSRNTGTSITRPVSHMPDAKRAQAPHPRRRNAGETGPRFRPRRDRRYCDDLPLRGSFLLSENVAIVHTEMVGPTEQCQQVNFACAKFVPCEVAPTILDHAAFS